MKRIALQSVRRSIGILGCLMLSLVMPQAIEASLENWPYRLSLTFEEPVGATLTNYPVQVKLGNTISGFSYAQFADSEAAADLRFSDAELETELPYEIEHWDTDGTSYIWVRIPTLEGTNETIYALWGMPDVEAPDYRTNGVVWTADYVGVWHLNEGDEGRTEGYIYKDSTTNKFHGQDFVAADAASGVYYNAPEMDPTEVGGFGDHVRIPDHDSLSFRDSNGDKPFSLSAWVYAHDDGVRIVSKSNTESGNQMEWSISLGTLDGSLAPVSMQCNAGGGSMRIRARSEPVVPLNQWVYIAGTYDGSENQHGFTLFMNGHALDIEEYYTDGTYSGMPNTDSTVDIGANLRNSASWSGFSDAIIDTVRIAASERSPEWILADYMTVASNDVFMTYGVVQTADPDLGVASSPPDPVRDTDATARGALLETGSEDNADVYVCWDTSDQLAVSTSDWSNVVFLGNYESYQSLSAVLSPLSPSSSYAYRFFATNSAGESAWSGVQAFDTVDVPEVSAFPATTIGRQVATLHGEVTDDGGETPLAGFEWWEVGVVVTTVVSKSFQDGAFSETLAGLTEATEYAYRVWASNAAGKVVSTETYSWTTLSSDPLAFYVTPDGAGDRDGSDWDNAGSLDDLPLILDLATVAGDEIRMRHGVYTNASQIELIDHAGLILRGGYEGSGSPGGFSSEETVLTRDPTIQTRIVYGKDSVLTLDRLTISGGDKLGTGGEHRYGAGVYLLDCATIITNSIIRNNELKLSSGVWSLYGAGLYARNGSLSIVDSVISNNRILSGNWNRGAGFYTRNVDLEMCRVDVVNNRLAGNSVFYGPGIGIDGGSALIVDSLFGTNRITSGHQHEGGALWASGASPLTISNSTFRLNYNLNSSSTRRNEGGAIWVQNSAEFLLADSVFDRNYITTGDPRRGSALHIGSTVNGLIADCTIIGGNAGNGLNQVWINTGSPRTLAVRNLHVQPGTATTGAGIRMQGSGTLAMTNILVHGFAGDGIQMDNASGTLELVNATLADNGGWGLINPYGTVSIINSIAWGNASGGFEEGVFGDMTVSYSSSQETHAGDGNREGDPGFVDGPAGNYRLTEGSDCVDAGSSDPWDGVIDAVDLDNEPRIRHGRVDRPLRVDMGAYERLIEVSGDLAVASHAASDVLPGEATANGMLLGAGNADDADVYVCWGTFDGETAATGNWTHVEFVGVYSNTFESFDHILDPLLGGTEYFYRFYAANSDFETAWSAVQSFTTIAPPSVEVADATHIGRDVATLRGDVTSTGGFTTEAGFDWWPVGGTPTSTVSRGTQSGSYDAELTGLSPDTEYAFRAWASNVVGKVWSAQTNHFITLDDGTTYGFYVTPDGAGLENGADWENAYSRHDLQFVIDIAAIDGDEILMRHGVYTNLLQTVIVNRPGLTIRGGYEGFGSPGDFGIDPTVLTRNPDFQARILLVTNSVLMLDRLTIRDGDMEGSGTGAYGADDRYGAGLYLRNSTTVITNCVIRNNVRTSAAHGSGYRGGGIYALNGSLTIVDSELRNNALGMGSGHTLDGGGLYAQNVNLELRRVELVGNRTTREISRGMGLRLQGGSALIADTTFATNRTDGGAYSQRGAGIFAENTSPLTITNCVFVGNYLSGGSGHSGQPRAGAGIWVNNSADFTLVDSRFEGHYVTATHADTPPNHGSAIFLESGVGGEIRNCEIVGANTGVGMQQVWINTGSPRTLAVRNLHVQPGTVTIGSGIRMQGSGTLAMTNILVHGFAGDGIQMDNASGTLDLVNATLADNAGWGVSKAAGTVSIINSIAWNNTVGCFQNPDAISYSSGQILHAGIGNIHGDPRFEEEAGDYRLQRISNAVDGGSDVPWTGVSDPLDLDGLPRIRNGRMDRSLRIDMGAYELPAPRGSMFMFR